MKCIDTITLIGAYHIFFQVVGATGADKLRRKAIVPCYSGYYPRPINGMAVAITVMNCTFADSGRLAMCSTASATC